MFKKVLGINLLVFVAYVLLITMSSSMANKGFNIAIGMGICVVIQVVLNGIAGIVCLIAGGNDAGRGLLISAAVLAPVGFCTWLILLSIFG
jgi:hypothetical protein